MYSYVVMHHPPFPAFDPPYAVGLIELTEGLRMISNVVGVPHDEVRIGMPVRLEFERAAILRDQINALKSGDYRKSAATPSQEYPRARRTAAAVRGKSRRR